MSQDTFIKRSLPEQGTLMRDVVKVTMPFPQFVYDCDPLQLKFLQLRSDIAKQSITYHCLNSTAWFNQEYGNYKHSIKLKGDNGIEMHAEGTRKYTPNIVMDECKV